MGYFGLRRSVTTAADPCYLLRVRYGLAPLLTHMLLFGNVYYCLVVFVVVVVCAHAVAVFCLSVFFVLFVSVFGCFVVWVVSVLSFYLCLIVIAY